MIDSVKNSVEYLQYFWEYRKTKLGLFIAICLILGFWVKYTDEENFVISTVIIVFFIIFIIFYWIFISGRVVLLKKSFSVAFCIHSKDAKSSQHIVNTFSHIKIDLDRLGLLEKFQFIFLGDDIIESKKQAHKYRDRTDVDLLIWGEVFSGSTIEKESSDFKHLFFTYKVPKKIQNKNLFNLYTADVNISLVNRDWNIYEVNSNPDTEKISCNLTEIIFFILGIIYLQEDDFAEDAIIILETLFNKLSNKTTGESVEHDKATNVISMSTDMLRKSRVLGILIEVYKNIGFYFTEKSDFKKSCHYLNLYILHKKPDIQVLSSLALSSFMLGDIVSSKKYTDEMKTVSKGNIIYLFNKGFFGIYEKNYSSALYFYKQIAKQNDIYDRSIITKVISFLDNIKEKNKHELAYDFAIGLVNIFFCQPKNGRIELRNFIKAARKRPEYSEMILYAQEVVGAKKKKRR